MNDRVIIAVRTTGDLLVKARPPNHRDPPTPILGFSYSCCNLITSQVVEHNPINGGWNVQTMNSSYKFFLGTAEDAQKIADEMGLEGPQQFGVPGSSLSFYWRKKEEEC